MEVNVISDEEFNELLVNIDELKADDIKKLAEKLEIEYTKKEETIESIKTFLGIEAKEVKPKANKQGLPIDRPLTEKEYLAAKYGKK